MKRLEKSSLPNTRPMIGMITSATSESTILPKAPPMITPTARSTTLPLTANSLNSLMKLMLDPRALVVENGAQYREEAWAQHGANLGSARVEFAIYAPLQ